MASVLVRNERRKLAATFLNTIGTGLVVVGVVAPLVAVWDKPPSGGAASLAVRAALFLVGGVTLHLLGQFILGGLTHD